MNDEARNTDGRVFAAPAAEAQTKSPRTPEGRMIGSEYSRTRGAVCPKCDSTNVGTLGPIMEWGGVDKLAQSRNCNSCGSSWVSIFRLAGYDQFADGDKIQRASP